MKKTKFDLAKRLAASILICQAICFLMILIIPSPARAQTKIQSLNFAPQISIPNSEFDGSAVPAGKYDEGTGKMDSDLLARYIKAFYNYGLTIAGILATLVLMGGGVLWLISGGDSGKVGQAKELITGSIVGMVILVCAWIILNTINPNLVNLKSVITPVVKKVSYCCDQTLGNIPMNQDGTCKTGAKCDSGSVCRNNKTAGQTTNNFVCINKNDYGCCEWRKNNQSLYCKAVKKGNPCPANPTGYTYGTYYAQWCENGEWNAGSDLTGTCLQKTAICGGADNTDSCYSGGSGTCYNEQCWVGVGKLNEPCGNDNGAKCFDGTIGDMCPDYYSHDDRGGRMCDTGLYCCYSTPSSK